MEFRLGAKSGKDEERRGEKEEAGYCSIDNEDRMKS